MAESLVGGKDTIGGKVCQREGNGERYPGHKEAKGKQNRGRDFLIAPHKLVADETGNHSQKAQNVTQSHPLSSRIQAETGKCNERDINDQTGSVV